MCKINEEQKKRLLEINQLFSEHQVKAIDRYQKIERELDVLLKKQDIDDFNLSIFFYCYTLDEKVITRLGVGEGDPIYKSELNYDQLACKESEWSTGLFIDSLLEGFSFCRLFYCVLVHSDLILESVLAIDYVYIDISVDYQWRMELNTSLNSNDFQL